MKKTFIVTASAALLAIGLSSPSYAATENTIRTYYTFTWNGFQFKVPVYQVQPTQPTQTTSPAETTQPTQTPTQTTTQTTTSPTSTNQTVISEAQQVVNLVNAERAKVGLAPLKLNTSLASVAKVKAEDMRDQNYFSHTSPKYGSPFDMMKSFGIKYSYAGENIAAGQKTPEEVMKSWMNSPGHKANILSSNFTEIGVGFAKGGSYGTYWVQQFIKP
ncbi:hypothetical protein EIZ39_14965 [Ammoniphilus sp. CFH 90114]|nr:hypothetical protein EIZ39_14965 [Ammoniphilus sp. CFH 90114]